MTQGVLVQNEGKPGSRTFALSGSGTLFGRAGSCDVPLADDNVSRNHARIERRRGRYLLSDLNSRNGTRVNGIAVARRFLREGDRILIGTAGFVFHEVDGRDALATAPFAIRTDGDEETTSTVTIADVAKYLPMNLIDRRGDAQALTAWQIVRSFGSCTVYGGGELLETIVEDLAGIRGMHRVTLHLRASASEPRAAWYRGGAERSRPGVLFPEERIAEVAKTGRALPESVACLPGKERASGVEADAVCFPVLIADAPAGALYAEGERSLTYETVEAVRSASEAIGLGLRLVAEGQQVSGRCVDMSQSLEIVGGSRALQQCVDVAGRAARSDATVLIRGESGTGRALFAQLIYTESRRNRAPFVRVHCGAMEEAPAGSALFGHEKGAHAGAVGMKRGLFEEADGGTVFLDEIGNLSRAMQESLLRVLRDGECVRFGGGTPIRVDVRVVAATNRDLEDAVRKGSFDDDLYGRLRVIQLRLLPLRERKEDIPDLVQHFIAELGASLDTRVRGVSEGALGVLARYDWPGNVRELRNVVERALVLARGAELTEADLPAGLVAAGSG